ncbi:ATP-binding protein [Methanobrevibacter curvatus]|nr:ATP-binding protein [Methanobrevibacter curvatus]
MINWEKTPAAIYRSKKGQLKPIFNNDPVKLDDLINIDHQKGILYQNTSKFTQGKMASHALIWGSRGTGKSSLVKALLNHFYSDGLRIIEFFKDDLEDLIDVVDEIRDLPYKFIIFCDDLSFDLNDASYKSIKVIMEGSVELPPNNILFYATSNRRHLIPEYFRDNDGVDVGSEEIHYSDSVEEKLSLADRFGLWISFYQGNQKEFLELIDSYFSDLDNEKREKLHKMAKNFSNLRSSRSGRTAKQFFQIYGEDFE